MPSVNRWSAYFTPAAEIASLGVECLGVGGQIGPVAPVARVLDHHALVFVDAGRGRLAGPSGEHAVAPGSMLQLFPGVWHDYGPDAQGWSEQWVLLRGSAVATYEALGVLDREAPVTLVADPDETLRILARLRSRRDDITRLGDARRSSDVHALLHSSAPAADPATDVVDRLLREPDGPGSVVEHARALGMTEHELRAATRAVSGTSPKALVLRGRIDRAKALLADTDLPVARVAARVGYDDPAYFARLFGRLSGTTPSRFRRRYLRPRDERDRDEWDRDV